MTQRFDEVARFDRAVVKECLSSIDGVISTYEELKDKDISSLFSFLASKIENREIYAENFSRAERFMKSSGIFDIPHYAAFGRDFLTYASLLGDASTLYASYECNKESDLEENYLNDLNAELDFLLGYRNNDYRDTRNGLLSEFVTQYMFQIYYLFDNQQDGADEYRYMVATLFNCLMLLNNDGDISREQVGKVFKVLSICEKVCKHYDIKNKGGAHESGSLLVDSVNVTILEEPTVQKMVVHNETLFEALYLRSRQETLEEDE